MLSLIRKNANSIWIKGGLFVVASTFLFFFGMTDVINKITGNDYIIKVGNVKIGPNLFKFEARKQAERLKKLGITDEAQLMNITLSQIADEELTKQLMRKYGIMVDENLVKIYMYSIPMFRDKNGSLNRGAIRTFMSNMEMHENEFISFLKKDIQSMILGLPLSMCMPKVVAAEYIKSNFEKRNIKYVYIPYNSFSTKQACTNEDLEECFKNNVNKFLIAEKRNFEVLMISEDDIMRNINISDNDIAEEYKTRGESENLEKVRWSIREDLVKAEFDSKLNELIRNIEDDFAAAVSCEEIAKKYNLKKADFKEIHENYISPTNSTTALPRQLMDSVIKTAFSLDAGQESSFIEGLGKSNEKIQWLVHTSSIVPAHPKPFAEVKNEVMQIWIQDKQKELAIEHVKGLCSTINSGVAIDFVAEKYNYAINELKNVIRTDKAMSSKFRGKNHISDDLLNKISNSAALSSEYIVTADGIVLFEVMNASEEKNIDKGQATKLAQKLSGEYTRELFHQLKAYNRKMIGVKINKKLLQGSEDTPMPDVDF